MEIELSNNLAVDITGKLVKPDNIVITKELVRSWPLFWYIIRREETNETETGAAILYYLDTERKARGWFAGLRFLREWKNGDPTY